MNRPCPTKVIFVTPFWGNPRTGPEVYAKYLWESFRDDPDIEFHLVAASEEDGAAHPRLHLIKHPGGSLALFKAVAHRALELTRQLGPHGILHVNNSNFHHSLLGSPWPIIGQINDYEAAHLCENILPNIRKNGLRRFASLLRRRLLEKIFLPRQALTLCNSEYTRDAVLKGYGLGNPSKIRVLYKAVDVGDFVRPVQSPPERSVRSHATTVVFIGTNFKLKGLDTLVLATKHMTGGANLVAVGPREKDFESAYPGLVGSARKSGSVLLFTGPVPRSEVAKFLWQSDVLCLPSRVEALGVALLEGVAAGLPCVASDVGGIPEIARHFNNVSLVRPNCPVLLARALEEAIGRRGTSSGPDKIRQIFGRETMIGAVKKAYLELAKTKELR